MKRTFGALCLAAMAAVCGGGEKPAEETQPAASQAQEKPQATEQAAQQAAKGLEQMAKGLEAMAGGGTGDMKAVDPVSFRDLMALFPDLDGWEKGKPTGERMTSPFAYSTAEVRYAKDDARIELKIVDSGFNQLLMAPYAMFLQSGYEKETSEGYEKSTTVNGQPGWEKWNTERKDGDVNALVGKRYLVTIEGRDIESVQVLHDLAARLDMAKLATLK